MTNTYLRSSVLLLLSGIPAAAQDTRPAPGETVLEDVIATIQDPERRAKLVAELEAILAAKRRAAGEPQETKPGGFVSLFGDLAGQLRRTLVLVVDQVGRIPGAVADLTRRLEDPEGRTRILTSVVTVIGIAVLGVLAAALAAAAMRRVRARAEVPPGSGHWPWFARLWRSLVRALFGLAPPLVLLAVGFAALAAAGPEPATRLFTMAVLWGLALARAASVLVDAVLAPGQPHVRVVPLRDEVAVPLAASVRRLLALAIYGAFFLEAVAAAAAPPDTLWVLTSVFGLILVCAGTVFVLRLRRPVRDWLARSSSGPAAVLGPDAAGATVAAAGAEPPSLLAAQVPAAGPGPGAGAAAGPGRPAASDSGSWRPIVASVLGLWWVAAIVFMAGLYVVWAAGVPDFFPFVVGATIWTVVTIGVATIALALLRRLVVRLEKGSGRLLPDYPELRTQIPRYVRGAGIVVGAAVSVLALSLVLEAWGVSAILALQSEAARTLFAAVLKVLLIVLLSSAAIDASTVFTKRYVENRERTGNVTAKVRTLVPLARKAVRLVVIIVAALMVLSNAGVEIGPILAGVGVLGLAIGFGAQTLVKDIITGVFILLEDTVAVGDVVTVNGTGGQVEAIDIRTMRLRDLKGNVHTIPYSSVTTITNMTKDFSRWLVEAAVSYREDVDEVIAVLTELGEELRKDPEFGKDIIEPMEVIGLDRFEDSAVIVRVRFTTKPLQQWRVGREFNRRLKKAFDARGIEMPFPQRTLWFGESKGGSAPPVRFREADRDPQAGAGRGLQQPSGPETQA